MQTSIFEKEQKVKALDKKKSKKYEIKNRNFDFNREKPLDILSLGFGMQSTCLAFMAGMGMIPKPDFVIFADTQAEPVHLYKYIERTIPLLKNLGINVIQCTTGSLEHNIKESISTGNTISIPLYFRGKDGRRKILKRYCTSVFKIEAINRKIRELTNRKRLPNHSVRTWIGITTEEKKRVTALYGTGKNKFRQMHYPFIQQLANVTYKAFDWRQAFGQNGFTRNDCINFFNSNGLEVPPKSSCYFCPFHDNEFWIKLRDERTSEWNNVLNLDAEIRDFKVKKMEGVKFYLHPSLIPLKDVILEKNTSQSKFDFSCNSGFCLK